MKDLITMSKKMSYALRHYPQDFKLSLDKEGWTDLDNFLKNLNITKENLDLIMKNMEKKRFEVKDGKIRAYYGHSIEEKIEKKEMEPPDILYHGTDPNVVPDIFKEGLKPMSRQYIHLSVDIKTAKMTGKRKCKVPALLVIDSKQAYADGLKFYLGNDDVWLADSIPSKYIK